MRIVSLAAALPVNFDGASCGGSPGPCLTQDSPGSSGMTLFANSVNANEWQ